MKFNDSRAGESIENREAISSPVVNELDIVRRPDRDVVFSRIEECLRPVDLVHDLSEISCETHHVNDVRIDVFFPGIHNFGIDCGRAFHDDSSQRTGQNYPRGSEKLSQTNLI